MNLDAVLLATFMRALHPYAHDIPALASALAAEAVATNTPFPIALLAVSVGYHEGSYQLGIVGDKGRARCVYQLHQAPEAVLKDARLCTRIALARLRHSVEHCPATPLAEYAGAPCGSAVADRISRHRIRTACRAYRRVLGPDAVCPLDEKP